MNICMTFNGWSENNQNAMRLMDLANVSTTWMQLFTIDDNKPCGHALCVLKVLLAKQEKSGSVVVVFEDHSNPPYLVVPVIFDHVQSWQCGSLI